MTPDPSIQRQVDNQGHDIARHQGILDAFQEDIASLQSQIEKQRRDMAEYEGVFTELHKKVVGNLDDAVASKEEFRLCYEQTPTRRYSTNFERNSLF
jgi:hypothetical protein